MKLLLRLLQTLIIVAVMFSLTVLNSRYESPFSVFEVDTISAATDGSECLDPAWVGCSVIWLQKGYVYDKAKGYYVLPSGVATTTAVTTARTTVASTTSRTIAVTTTAKTTAATTKANTAATTNAPAVTTVSAVSSPVVTTTASVEGIASVTSVSYTTRVRPPRNTGAVTTRKSSGGMDGSFLNGLPLGVLSGVLGIIGIMVVEFFIVRAIYKKD